MLRPSPRYLPLQENILRSSLFRHPRISLHQNRFVSTSPTQRPRSWKSLFVRVGLAAGVVYFYNTSTLFAEEPPYAIPHSHPSSEDGEAALPTVDGLMTRRPSTPPAPSLASLPHAAPNDGSIPSSASLQSTTPPSPGSPQLSSPSSLEETEEEASQQGAFNEETGEINWDCPCLGGMAHGTCGEQFRAAFSCFVYSKEEPKGMDCIDNFKTMQGCFREHPDEYGAELEEDEEEGDYPDGEVDHQKIDQGSTASSAAQSGENIQPPKYPSGEPIPEPAQKGLQVATEIDSATGSTASPSPSAASSTVTTLSSSPSSAPASLSSSTSTTSSKGSNPNQRAKSAKTQVKAQHSDPLSESNDLVPKAAHDAQGSSSDAESKE